MEKHDLSAAPATVFDAAGLPRFGTYAGELNEVDLRLASAPGNALVASAARLLREKKWVYTLVATPEVVALAAIVDLGYSAQAFVTVVDLQRKLKVFDESFLQIPGPLVTVSGPGKSLQARFRTAFAELRVDRDPSSDRYRIAVEVSRLRRPFSGGLRWNAELLAAGGPPAVSVIAPVGDSAVNVTQKSAALLASGELRTGGRHYRLDGGVGGLDFTHGMLARHTAWRWAFAQGRLADGTAIGVNLVEGFNETHPEANENALWLGGRLVPLSRARFSFNQADPFDRWRLRTVDGEVDLTFHPVHAHREERDLVLVKSRFIQPVGLFSGTVTIDGERHQLNDVPGVTEDQDVVW